MICFQVKINGKILGTAGIGEFGVLTAILTWAKTRPKRNRKGVSDKERSAADLFFSLSGLAIKKDRDEHVRWLDRRVKPGDEISVRIVQNSKADKPKFKKKQPKPKPSLE